MVGKPRCKDFGNEGWRHGVLFHFLLKVGNRVKQPGLHTRVTKGLYAPFKVAGGGNHALSSLLMEQGVKGVSLIPCHNFCLLQISVAIFVLLILSMIPSLVGVHFGVV